MYPTPFLALSLSSESVVCLRRRQITDPECLNRNVDQMLTVPSSVRRDTAGAGEGRSAEIGVSRKVGGCGSGRGPGALGGGTRKPEEEVAASAPAPTCHTLALGVGAVSGPCWGPRVPECCSGMF